MKTHRKNSVRTRRLDAAFFRAAREDARSAQQSECAYCFRRLTARSATADHVVPRAHYGKDERNNIVAACEPCNQAKGHMPASLFKRMITSPRPGEPMRFRLIGFDRRLNLAVKRFERRMRKLVGASW